MTQLGDFRDDYYNSSAVLAQSGIATTTQNGGTIAAANLVGAQDQYLLVSGQAGAQALATDTAANIIAALQNAVATAQAAAGAFPSLLSGAQGNPPNGVPNLFNLAYTLTINNGNTVAGAITLSAGAGVTLVAGAPIAITTSVTFVVKVTGGNTVSMTRVASGTV